MVSTVNKIIKKKKTGMSNVDNDRTASATYSVPEGVLKEGVGLGCCPSTSTQVGGNVKFNLFLLILLMLLLAKQSRD